MQSAVALSWAVKVDVATLQVTVTFTFSGLANRWKPSSRVVICTSLRSYLRFRAMRGDDTRGLAATPPSAKVRQPERQQSKIPKYFGLGPACAVRTGTRKRMPSTEATSPPSHT